MKPRHMLLSAALISTVVATGVITVRFIMDHTLWGRHRVADRLQEIRIEAAANPSDSRPIEKLIEALEHGRTSFERTYAASELAMLRSRAVPATDALVAAVQGSDPYVAPQAAKALGEIGPEAATAVPVLVKMMELHPDDSTGWMSAVALGKIARPDDTAVRAALEKASKSDNLNMVTRAKFAMETMEARKRQPTDSIN